MPKYRTGLCSSLLLLSSMSMFGLQGCSHKQVYNSGTHWRQHECRTIVDRLEKQRCLDDANRNYRDYQHQINASQP